MNHDGAQSLLQYRLGAVRPEGTESWGRGPQTEESLLAAMI